MPPFGELAMQPYATEHQPSAIRKRRRKGLAPVNGGACLTLREKDDMFLASTFTSVGCNHNSEDHAPLLRRHMVTGCLGANTWIVPPATPVDLLAGVSHPVLKHKTLNGETLTSAPIVLIPRVKMYLMANDSCMSGV